METYIKKMKEIVKEHYSSFVTKIDDSNILLDSYKLLDGNVECCFRVSAYADKLVYYKVIYYLEYNEFRVLCFKFLEQFDTNG